MCASINNNNTHTQSSFSYFVIILSESCFYNFAFSSSPQVYLVSSAVTTTTAHFYGTAYHPAVFYLPPQPYSPFFRSPYYNPFPYYPTPSYFAPPSYPGGSNRVVTPGSDVVVNKPASKAALRSNQADDTTVVVEAVEAAPARAPFPSDPKLIDPAVISPGLVYQAKSTPDVITHGMHLGNVQPNQEGYSQDGWAQDAPASTITQGPNPGSYTAVSSDEESEGTLFQSQDGNGNILFGYSSPQQARLESRSLDGSVRGSYSYIDPTGQTVKVRYAAGRNGFQVFDEEGSPSVLPRAVQDTPEVEAAKALHSRLYQQAKWLAEQPEEGVHNEEKQSEGELYDVDDKFHPPDSLYAVGEGLKGVEEDLEYYGAAKGQHMVYASRFNSYGVHPHEQQHLHRATLGAEAFPSAPRLSPFSAPSFREQQHLHRSAKSLKQARNPIPEGYLEQTVPVFVGVAPQSDEIASTRTAASPLPDEVPSHNQRQQQAVPPASISQKANFFGAVPVAAVHDSQVSPAQRVQDHQTKPVYIEAN